MLKIASILSAVLCSISAQALTVDEAQISIEQKKKEIAIQQAETVLIKSVEVYNATAVVQNLPTINNIEKGEMEMLSSWGAPILQAAGTLSNETLCIVTPSSNSPVNYEIGEYMGSREALYNNQYYVLTLDCSDAQTYQLIKIVDGEWILDDLNPYPNSGKVHYEIKVGSAR